MSRLMQAAIESVYAPFARSQDLPAANLRVHPDEDAIVAEGVEQHLSRLRRELTTARPERVVTLGNAALRVLRHLLQLPTGTERLSSDRELYGREVQVTLDGRAVAWFPLAHPGSPDTYQSAHREWVMTRR
jgi:uracil-DNA glycosylase